MKSKEEIEKSANEFSKDYIKTTNNSILQSSFKLEVGYIKGYTQCQEDMADKKYTEEDIRKAFNWQRKTIEQLQADKKELVNGLIEGKLQIDNLHTKFAPTGTGNGVLSRLEKLISKHI
jgi:queuine/archaeosine tRNA-ribosyltransferase